MQLRPFGNTDMQVSPLGFGGSEIGFEGVNDATELLNAALDIGVNVIDSAAAYLRSEELIGAAIGHRRKEYYLFTKCGAVDGFSRSDWSAHGIRSTIEQSLKSLRTDYLDLIQLHSCSAGTLQQGEAIEALQLAKRDGLVRYIGYSGDGEDAVAAIALGVFDSLQTSVNIADQQPLTLTLPKARERGMAVIAKRPIANAAWRTGQLPTSAYHHTYFRRLETLAYPFLKQPLTESSAIALRFTVFQLGVSTAIVGTTKPARFRENVDALMQGPLEPELLASIAARWAEVGGDWSGQV
jgi:aryl-alcohol dehydrogenase-like predicted oxidoreductase